MTMKEKDNQELRLFVDGKQVGYSKEAKINGLSTEPNSDAETFRNMIDKKCYTMSFEAKVSEETKDFFTRMMEEMKDKETAIRERIETLFNEKCQFGSDLDKKETDKAYMQLLTLFSIGYKLGWNDYYHLNNKT